MSLLFMSKSRFCYHVSVQSSSASEIASYLILINIHKKGHMIDEWSHDRRITHVVESLAKVTVKRELVMKRWNVKYAKKLA